MEKIKSFFKNKKYVGITIVVILALALPLVVNQALHQQKTQQHADSAPEVTYNFDPATSAIKPNDTFPVDVNVNTGINDIGSIEFTLKYDNTLLQPVSTTAKGGFELGKQEVTNNGYHVILINPTTTQITGDNVTVAEITFKALKDGTATITIDNTNDMHTTASTFYTYVPPSNATTTGTYTISENAITPTPGPNPCQDGITSWQMGRSCRIGSGTYRNGYYTCTDGTSGAITTTSCATPESLLKQAKQKCSSSPKICPSLPPSISPTPSTDCNVSTQKPGGCACANNSECQSSACIPLPPEQPTGGITPSDTTTPSPIPNQPFGVCAEPAPSITPIVSPTPQPTQTPMPTPSISPDNTALNVAVTLLGISSNPSDNQAPFRPSRAATVEIFDAQNKQVGQDITGTLTFDSSKFEYVGMLDLGSDFTTGQYTVKIKLDNTLYKRYPGIITITQKSHDNSTGTPIQLVSGDINQDNVLDITDWTDFVACFNGDNSCTDTQKMLADFNDNDYAKDDLTDMAILQKGFATRNGD